MKQLNTTLSTLSRLLMMSVVMLLPVSCIEDSMDKSATGEGMVPINLTISPKAVSTRTATTDIQSAQLASGQQFYAYFTSANVVPQSTTFTANGSGGTTPATQPYFKLSETSTDVRAYYPSSVTEATTSFTVEANQSGDDAYRASDLMFASANITKVFPASTGALTFAHKMAKIKVTTTTRVSSIKTIKLKGILPTVPFNASDGTLGTASGSATDITMYSHSGQTANINCVALIPPQSKAADATLIEVTSALHSSTPLTYKLPNAITFQSGLQYIFNVDLHEEQLVVTCTVSPWSSTTTNSAEVNVNRPTLPIEYIAPYNMATATTMATDNNPNSSAYFYWGSNSTSLTTNMKNFINGTAMSGYHLPSKAEWNAILAPYYAGSDDSNMGGSDSQRITFMRGSSNNLSETVGWGVKNNNTNSTYSTANYVFDVLRTFYNDYNCPNDAVHTYIGYALRFKEKIGDNYVNGLYTCAYRYEYKSTDASVGGGASLTIKVTYVGTNTGITISTISNESWWSTSDYSLVIPACGNKGMNSSDYAAGSYSSASYKANAYYWTATAKDASSVYNMNFNPSHVRGNHFGSSTYGFTVRLFKDAD